METLTENKPQKNTLVFADFSYEQVLHEIDKVLKEIKKLGLRESENAPSVPT